MRSDQDWVEAETTLKDAWKHRAEIFATWQAEESFVEAQMTLMQCAYEGGYADALDDIKEAARSLDDVVSSTLSYLGDD